MAPANAPGEASLSGAILSRRYVLKHEIGRGGMGSVYAAEPLGGGALVAIKMLHPDFLSDEQVRTRFLEEGRTCMRLVHPNILRVRECLVAEDGSPYLVMDLLEGVPLSAYTKDGGRVALAHAIPILQGILAALEAAHALGVVHRDLKPGNVFLARKAGVFSVKLLDFGIAKVMDAAGGMSTKTRTGALLGTPAYMSPEQVKNAKDVDGRSDLWSVGVLFYEILTGRVAFPAPTEYARLAAVLSSTPTPIQTIDAQLASVAAFVERALEKDRERRFQSAREMALVLGPLLPASSLSTTGSPAAPSFAPDANQPTLLSASGAPHDASPWSMVTDRIATPNALNAPLLGSANLPLASDLLAAEIFPAPDVSTLASPNRVVRPTVSRSSRPPPEVVILEDAAIDAARERETVAPPQTPELPPKSRGLSMPSVTLLVAVALAVGFAVGHFVPLGR